MNLCVHFTSLNWKQLRHECSRSIINNCHNATCSIHINNTTALGRTLPPWRTRTERDQHQIDRLRFRASDIDPSQVQTKLQGSIVCRIINQTKTDFGNFVLLSLFSLSLFLLFINMLDQISQIHHTSKHYMPVMG